MGSVKISIKVVIFYEKLDQSDHREQKKGKKTKCAIILKRTVYKYNCILLVKMHTLLSFGQNYLECDYKLSKVVGVVFVLILINKRKIKQEIIKLDIPPKLVYCRFGMLSYLFFFRFDVTCTFYDFLSIMSGYTSLFFNICLLI
uniref:Transmembrane protein n=1 Tax=Heterorhabditis bacteriophora TaxID=37862 RepID=A0A1I7W6M7_HETBA